MERIRSFDYIRACSVFGILLCHFCFNWDRTIGTGRWFGCTFNVVFLLISALLLGKSWAAKGRLKLTGQFLKQRLFRLAVSYYPFLVAMFLFLWTTGHPLRLFDWVMHFAFLPWFDKLPGFGHLWFLTMISFCYLGTWWSSRWNRMKPRWLFWAVCFAIVLHVCSLRHGLPGQMFSYFIVFLVVFHYSAEIVLKIKRIRNGALLHFGGMVLLLLSLGLFHQDLYRHHRFIAEWVGILDACIVVVMMLLAFDKAPRNGFVDFTSRISFEIYLVHHVVSYGTYSVPKLVDDPLAGWLLLLVVSYAMGAGLHYFGKYVIVFGNRALSTKTTDPSC